MPPRLSSGFLFCLCFGTLSASGAFGAGESKTALPGFGFESVEAEAKLLAGNPFSAAQERPSPYFLNLSYDRFRDIRYLPEKAQWAGTASPFRAQFFHPGLFHDRIERVFTVEDGKIAEVSYERDRYDFGAFPPPSGTEYPRGYAGFRWHGEVNSPGIWDEFAVFVGATYFRCVPTGCDAVYGLSARAIAVNTAAPGVPEDFPFFRKVWLERPRSGDRGAVALALMDSPNVTGAFRFEVIPGRVSRTLVRATVFVRRAVERLGLAPFSSMFWYGENSATRPRDFRPEVHDSDGLLVEDVQGLSHWRPLLNDRGEIRHSVFSVGGARAFGLRQRDLDFDSYQDLEARYHRRPGVRVVPGAGWPAGSVHLFELSSSDETWDNVVSYWQPERIPGPGESLSFEYTIEWACEPDFASALARVLASRSGLLDHSPGVVRHVVDFSAVPGEPAGLAEPNLRTDVYGDGESVRTQIYRNAETGGWRVVFEVKPTLPQSGRPGAAPARASLGMRAWLERAGKCVSERWDNRPESTLAEIPAAKSPAN